MSSLKSLPGINQQVKIHYYSKEHEFHDLLLKIRITKQTPESTYQSEVNFYSKKQISHIRLHTKLCFNKVVIANQKKRCQPNFNVQLEIMLLQNCRNTVKTQQLPTRYTSQLMCFKENKFEIFFVRFHFFH